MSDDFVPAWPDARPIDPTDLTPAVMLRLFSRCAWNGNGCLIMSGTDYGGGYRRFSPAGRGILYAHRVMWVWANGRDIPPGLVIDHLCRVKACVNPAHLEPVTQAENTRRGESPTSRNHRAGVCKWGHDLTLPGAWYVSPGRQRSCRKCKDGRNARKLATAVAAREALRDHAPRPKDGTTT